MTVSGSDVTFFCSTACTLDLSFFFLRALSTRVGFTSAVARRNTLCVRAPQTGLLLLFGE